MVASIMVPGNSAVPRGKPWQFTIGLKMEPLTSNIYVHNNGGKYELGNFHVFPVCIETEREIFTQY